MSRHIHVAVLAVSMLAACNALDKRSSSANTITVVPTDTRSVQQALRALPAISGGTLAVTPDGTYAVAADPDRDRVSIVNLQNGSVQHIALELGAEPGRVAIDAQLRAYVALRRAGDLARIDVQGGALIDRTHVCSTPRGVAVDSARAQVHVACADGRLVSVNASDGAIARDLDLGKELRDVVVGDHQLLVSTFKSAQIVQVDDDGNVAAPMQPNTFNLPKPLQGATAPGELPSSSASSAGASRAMQPELAWRMIATGTGPNDVMMLHQGATTDTVDVKPTGDDPNAASGMSAASPYGGGALCAGVVSANVTPFGASGPGSTVALGNATLAVDMAISPVDHSIAIAEAGPADPDAPHPFTVINDSGKGVSVATAGPGPAIFPGQQAGPSGPGRVLRFSLAGEAPLPTLPGNAVCQQSSKLAMPGQITAVAFTSSGDLVAQSREPAMLIVGTPPALAPTPFDISEPLPGGRTISLGGDSMFDTGHELFHRDSGGGIACASCHGEGAEDGHTWMFSDVGARRTQALHVGLEGTAPFHWNGDLPTVGSLMERVFVGRMGGVHQGKERVDALTHFLYGLTPPPPIVAANDPSAQRGKSLFESADVGCSGCHQGAKLTNNKDYDVGTGTPNQRFQVPSLRAVGYRAPFIHTGCASTLRERFDPKCGGASHGHTSQLDDGQIDDLIAYLRSL